MSEDTRYASDPCHSRFLTWVNVKHGGAELGDVVVAQYFDAEQALRIEAERQVGELREQLYNAESDARNASALLADVVEWFDDGVGRSDMEFKLLRKIDQWLNGSSAEAQINEVASTLDDYTTSTEGKDHE